MAWQLTGHAKTQRITAELARQFAEMDPAPDDRPLSENRLKVYENVARAGHFRPVEWSVAFCKETGGTYRVNGKHTSTLFARLPLADIPPLFAVVQRYECDTLTDVSRLYSTFDSRTQSRTVSDINRTFAACVPSLHGVVAPRLIDLCISAIWYSSKLGDYTRIPPQERAEVILEHPDFALWANEVLGGKKHSNSHIAIMPVIAAMYATYQKAPRIATTFWTAVKDRDGESVKTPTRRLGEWLLVVKAGRGRYTNTGSRIRKIPEREYFVKCIHAWNAYRAGETTNLNYHANADVPAIK